LRVRFPGPGSPRKASKHEQEIEGYGQQETCAPGGRKSIRQEGRAKEGGARQAGAEKACRQGRPQVAGEASPEERS
jgi:hypothetical protein